MATVARSAGPVSHSDQLRYFAGSRWQALPTTGGLANGGCVEPRLLHILKEDIASGRVGRCTQRRTAMNGYPPRKPKSARRVAFPKWAFVGAIAGAALISACSQSSDSQQTGAQPQAADEQARQEADEKAWADAEKGGTAAAFTGYVQKFGPGAHVAEARQRLAALDEQVRKEADEKAWADAEKAGTATAFTGYVQKFGSGAHVAEARQRAAALETLGRKEQPAIDIQNTCKLAAAAMGTLMGGTTTR